MKKIKIDLEIEINKLDVYTLKSVIMLLIQLLSMRERDKSKIQIRNIDLNERILTIKESCIWANANKTFVCLSPFPKNKEIRKC